MGRKRGKQRSVLRKKKARIRGEKYKRRLSAWGPKMVG